MNEISNLYIMLQRTFPGVPIDRTFIDKDCEDVQADAREIISLRSETKPCRPNVGLDCELLHIRYSRAAAWPRSLCDTAVVGGHSFPHLVSHESRARRASIYSLAKHVLHYRSYEACVKENLAVDSMAPQKHSTPCICDPRACIRSPIRVLP